MQKFIISVIGAVILFGLSGCSSLGPVFGPSSRGWGLDPVAESQLPPTQVRRSSTYITTLGGGYTYSHDQGESRSVYTGPGYYGQPTVDYSRSSWSNTYESHRTPVYYSYPVVDAPFVYPGGTRSSGGVYGGSGAVTRPYR